MGGNIMRKAIVDGRTGITVGRRTSGDVAVLFDNSDEIVWISADEAVKAIQD